MMATRTAVAESLALPPAKRLRLDRDLDLNIETDTNTTIDDDLYTAQSPISTADTVSSPATTTAATTPKTPRFPSDLKTLPCTWPGCPKTFNRPARLRDHLNSHTNSRPFVCPYDGCEKDYTVDKHLKQHIKATHTQERKHVCPREGCGKSFVTGTRLKRHQAVHEGAERFRCQDCGQSFRKKDTLAKHVRKEHQGLKGFPCAEKGCDAAFDTKASLRKHVEREHGTARFWCHECAKQSSPDGEPRGTGFTTELLLQNHLKQEHQDCMFCEFRSSKQGDLERHVEMHHSGKTVDDRRTEPCSYPDCDKWFTNRSNRNNHVRTVHEGQRFICGGITINIGGWSNDQGCGEHFTSKARLEDHVRYVHLRQDRPKVSVPAIVPEQERPGYLDTLVHGAVDAVYTCYVCTLPFNGPEEVDAHIATEHQSFDPDSFFQDGEALDAGLFGMDSQCPADNEQEVIFAADVDYGAANDAWAQDEENIFNLASDSPRRENGPIDPNLL
ncbi:Transcription factor-like protein [Emericellopsis cladophorae]|uniref:Transcription factor-like protein n=1 Tax=Emericellopsis cladophorae TaxID=2686198 RepID=A0A9P9Y5V7_9HYPO|nr:Transcription factor-like protein [Emericellopsis cladophorae]KAI6783910.1 Transcription factor-like protein [Emericellopsis cladophorae]